MGAGLYYPLGAQMFPLQPPRGFFGTNHSMRHHPLLSSSRVGQPGPLRWLASRLCLRGRFPSLIGGGHLPSLVRGGLFPAPIRGWLASILMPSRGSSCQGPSLGQPLRVRSTAWLGYGSHGSLGYRMPLEAWAGLELTQLCQFPVVVASEPYPPCEVTEAF